MVLETFVGEPTPNQQVRHLNGDKRNNCLDNLAWGTAKENAADRESHGNTARGTRNGNSRLARQSLSRMQLQEK
jgi:hypothetical protein